MKKTLDIFNSKKESLPPKGRSLSHSKSLRGKDGIVDEEGRVR